MALALDSVAPPAGPRAPRFTLKDETVACAESRTAAGPRGALSLLGHVSWDTFIAPRYAQCLGGRPGVRADMLRVTSRGLGARRREHVVRDMSVRTCCG